MLSYLVLEKSLESPLNVEAIQSVHPKGDQSWLSIRKTDVEAETPILGHLMPKKLTHLKRPWCWERFRAGGIGDNRGWDGQMASLTQWTSVWINSRSWWRTGRPGILQSMGSQSQTQLSDWTELLLGRKAIATLYSMLKGRATTLLTKVCIVKYLVLPVVSYGCDSWDHKEAWTLKSWSFSLEVLEKTLESPLDDKEIKEVNPKDQPWTFTTRSAAEAPILWPPDANSQLKGEDLDAGKAGGKRRGQQKMRWFDGITGFKVYESEQTQGDSEG